MEENIFSKRMLADRKALFDASRLVLLPLSKEKNDMANVAGLAFCC